MTDCVVIKTKRNGVRIFKNPPQPHMCIQDHMQGSELPCYVNVLSWDKVAVPRNLGGIVPLYGGMRVSPPRGEKPEVGVFAVIANPEPLKLYGKNAQDPKERSTLIEAVLDFVETANEGVYFSRQYTILKDKDITGELKEVWMAVQSEMDRETLQPQQETWIDAQPTAPQYPQYSEQQQTQQQQLQTAPQQQQQQQQHMEYAQPPQYRSNAAYTVGSVPNNEIVNHEREIRFNYQQQNPVVTQGDQIFHFFNPQDRCYNYRERGRQNVPQNPNQQNCPVYPAPQYQFQQIPRLTVSQYINPKMHINSNPNYNMPNQDYKMNLDFPSKFYDIHIQQQHHIQQHQQQQQHIQQNQVQQQNIQHQVQQQQNIQHQVQQQQNIQHQVQQQQQIQQHQVQHQNIQQQNIQHQVQQQHMQHQVQQQQIQQHQIQMQQHQIQEQQQSVNYHQPSNQQYQRQTQQQQQQQQSQHQSPENQGDGGNMRSNPNSNSMKRAKRKVSCAPSSGHEKTNNGGKWSYYRRLAKLEQYDRQKQEQQQQQQQQQHLTPNDAESQFQLYQNDMTNNGTDVPKQTKTIFLTRRVITRSSNNWSPQEKILQTKCDSTMNSNDQDEGYHQAYTILKKPEASATSGESNVPMSSRLEDEIDQKLSQISIEDCKDATEVNAVLS